MKRVFALSFLLAVSPTVFGQSGGTKGMDMKDMPAKGTDMKIDKKSAKGTVHKATGVITKMAGDKVTIKHEPVPSMNWPTMTMAFRVKDKSLLDQMKSGQKINFEFMQEGREYVVTGIK